MSQPVLEFFWDPASPYTYFASTRIEALAGQCNVQLHWRPFLIGAAFKATGNAPPAIAVPAKGRYMMQDLKLCAAHLGIPVTLPTSFPLNSLLPQRMATAVQLQAPEQLPAFAKALMAAHWGEGRDIAQPQALLALAATLGLDGAALLQAASTQPVKDALRECCESAIARGAFGAPTFFAGKQMFWGHDRMEVMAAYLQGKLDV